MSACNVSRFESQGIYYLLVPEETVLLDEVGILERVIDRPNFPSFDLERPLIVLTNVNVVELFDVSPEYDVKFRRQITRITYVLALEVEFRFEHTEESSRLFIFQVQFNEEIAFD